MVKKQGKSSMKMVNNIILCDECSENAVWTRDVDKERIINDEQMAKELDCSVEEVIEATDKFHRDGFIKKYKNDDNSNRYVFNFKINTHLCDNHYRLQNKVDKF
jgi:hypothetical protein